MEILIGLLFLTIAGAAAQKFFYDTFLCFLCMIMGGFFLLIALLLLPLYRMTVEAKTAEFNSIKVTFNEANRLSQLTVNAAIQIKIAEANQWLASTQYWNKTALDIWIPDTVDALETIK